MKKERKHHFKYTDPEKIKESEASKEKSVSLKPTSQIVAEKDFKKVTITIIIFVILIVLFIFLDNKLELNRLIPTF